MTASLTAAPSLRQRAQTVIGASLRSRPVQAYLVLWVACALILFVNGHSPFFGLLNLIGIGILCLITALNTTPQPHAIETQPAERRKLYAQLIVIGVFIALTTVSGMVFHNLLPADFSIPVWTPFVGAIERFSGQTFGNDNYVANPVQYFVLPLIALLLLGAKLPDLGLGRGVRVWRVAFIWCVIPVLAIAYLIVTGAALERVGRVLISNTLQNGFFEEFLFRGALQTRLRRLMSPGWAIILQAVLFGLWHVGLGYSNYGEPGGLISALASTIIMQGIYGIAFGLMMERTRNLIAPSLFHVLSNAMFQI